jgi:hypothetical protein
VTAPSPSCSSCLAASFSRVHAVTPGSESSDCGELPVVTAVDDEANGVTSGRQTDFACNCSEKRGSIADHGWHVRRKGQGGLSIMPTTDISGHG